MLPRLHLRGRHFSHARPFLRALSTAIVLRSQGPSLPQSPKMTEQNPAKKGDSLWTLGDSTPLTCSDRGEREGSRGKGCQVRCQTSEETTERD